MNHVVTNHKPTVRPDEGPDVLNHGVAATLAANPLDALTPEQQERLSEILEAYLDGLEQGRPSDPDALIQDHPELAEPLRWYLRGLDFVHHATAELGPKEPSEDPGNASENELGDFEILREVGRGGMGVVYEARQKSLGRRVALKVLPFAAVLDRRQIIRFKNEAQAAAQLHHPHIVPVHSVGCDRGVHYYSMQFIDGQPLDKAISQLRQSRDARRDDADASGSTVPIGVFSTLRSIRSHGHMTAAAELIRQAATAIEHAHEFGVVHRDIKPSNLLIDQQGKLWVTDFGLARCQNSITITMTGDLLGTIRYMSPEAAAGRGSLVDHISDVYSLGVTLYELLTLEPPHDATDRVTMLDQIQRQHPERPRRLNPAIPIDLETIVLKAIQKPRDDRYQSAAAMAEDLARFLAGKPPLAKRPTVIDYVSQWATRHRTLVASIVAALALTTLTAGSAAMLLSNEKSRTEAALQTAESNFQQSQLNLQKAIDVVDRFGMRLATKLAGVPGTETVRQSILQETLADYQSFAQQMDGDASMRFALALCNTQMASMHRQLGRFSEAVTCYETAIGLYQALLQSDEQKSAPNHARIGHDLAVCHNNLGELAFQQGDFPKAEREYQRARQIIDSLDTADQDDLKIKHLRIAALVNVGNLERAVGNALQSRRTYENAIDMQSELIEIDPDNAEYQRELAVSYAQLSFLFASNDLDAADRYNQLAIALHKKLAERRPHDLAALSELATCYNHRGAIFNRRGRTDEALKAYQEAIDAQQVLVMRAPTSSRFKEQLAVAHNNLGQVVLSSEAAPADAISHFKKAESLLNELVSTSPLSPHYRAQLGGVLSNLAPLLENSDPQSARKYYDDAIEHQRWAVERSPQVHDFRVWLNASYVKYGRFWKRQGQSDQAGEVALQRRELWSDDPNHLYRVTLELAEAAVGDGESTLLPRQRWIDETVQTWQLAVAAGLKDLESKRKDPTLQKVMRFADQFTSVEPSQ
ncbi:serine/threonine-protein kinase [Stieleria mannarensis]|uniref:serine/threonine-protein kinase n=1 Tax=Stieleria mannarensis TaxID=2755585 RepID=UPI00160419B1|nr:serine/threonine-protein kinase [Rhodopirellula sp. JC639]